MRQETQAGAGGSLGDPPAAAAPQVPRAQPGLHRRLTINSLSNLGSYLVSLGIAFALTPFIVRSLGNSLYGFWVLLTTFIGYASVLEMGVQPAVVKLVGQYRARGDLERLRDLLQAAFVFFAAAGALSAFVLAVVLPPFVPRFVEELATVPHIRTLFMVIAADAIVMFMNYLASGILYGHQLYYAKNLIDITMWIVNAGLLVAFLPQGGLLVVALCKLGTDVLTLAASAVICTRSIAGLASRRPRLARHTFRELLGFSSQIFVSATTTRLAVYAQPLIIGTALSSTATAFYAIPSRLVDYCRQVTMGLTTGFLPMFSELHSRQEHQLLESIYMRYSRYVLLATLPLPILLFALGRPFIGLWIGPEYAERGGRVLLLLAGGVLVESFQPLLWRFFAGVGHLGVLVRVSAITSSLVIAAGIALVVPLGIAGVAMAVFMGSVVSQSLFAFEACRFLRIGVPTLLGRVHLRPAVAASMALLATVAVTRVTGTASYRALFLGACACLAVYAPLAYLLALEPGERDWLKNRIARRIR